MQQAIETKFHGPTNSSGSRISAKAWVGSKRVHYNHALNADQNHLEAAKALAEKMEWRGLWIGGGKADGSGYTFVCLPGSYSRAWVDKYIPGVEGCDWFFLPAIKPDWSAK
jgi:hypothetical protein